MVMSTMVPRPISIRAKLKGRHIADFQGGKCKFAPSYLKISEEGETFSAILIIGTMHIMLLIWIFDIRTNYVARFVKIRHIANFLG